MLNIIIILIILLILATLFNKNNEIFVSANNVDFLLSRPNCPQLNDPTVCSETPGCFSTNYGCINNYRELKEPQKAWEKGDFMVVY